MIVNPYKYAIVNPDGIVVARTHRWITAAIAAEATECSVQVPWTKIPRMMPV